MQAMKEFYGEFVALQDKVFGFEAEVKTEKLCVGNVCINEAELEALLQNSNVEASASTEEPVVKSTPEETPGEEEVPAPTEPIVEELTEESVEESVPEEVSEEEVVEETPVAPEVTTAE